MINIAVYMDLTWVIHLKCIGNTRGIHVKYTRNTLKMHRKYTDYTQNKRATPHTLLLHQVPHFLKHYTNYTKITPRVVRIHVWY